MGEIGLNNKVGALQDEKADKKAPKKQDKNNKHKVKVNYQRKLDELIKNLDGQVKSVLLHSCCAPCSSYCIEYLSKYFKITVFFYNPNIHPREEYLKRVEEQKDLIKTMDAPHGLDFIEGDYDVKTFYKESRGRALEVEGGESCERCYDFRLRKSAELAKDLGYDYFATTLSISPHKNSQLLNRLGESLSSEVGVKHLPSDFKKKGGFKRSIELSDMLGLYRQDYCGCVFSKKERDIRYAEYEKKIAEDSGVKLVVSGCGENCRHKDVLGLVGGTD